MAQDKKKKKPTPGKPKKKVSPQTRTKLSQQAKRRQRGPKHTPNAGEFRGSGIHKVDLSHIFHGTIHGRMANRIERPHGGDKPGQRHYQRSLGDEIESQDIEGADALRNPEHPLEQPERWGEAVPEETRKGGKTKKSSSEPQGEAPIPGQKRRKTGNKESQPDAEEATAQAKRKGRKGEDPNRESSKDEAGFEQNDPLPDQDVNMEHREYDDEMNDYINDPRRAITGDPEINEPDHYRESGNFSVPLTVRSDNTPESRVNATDNTVITEYKSAFQKHKEGLNRSVGRQLSTKQIEEEAAKRAELETKSRYGRSPSAGDFIRQTRDEIDVRKESTEEASKRADEEQLWKTQRGVYYGNPKPDGPVTWDPSRADNKETPSSVIPKLPSSEQQWLDEQMNTSGSHFYGASGRDYDSGAKRRLRRYTDLRQEGYSSDEILQYFDEGQSNKQKGPKQSGDAKSSGDNLRDAAREDVESKMKGDQKGGLKDKYDRQQGKEDFSWSYQAPGIETLDDLRKRFPDWPEGKVIEYHEAQRQSAYDYSLERNEKWAHERRRYNFDGRKDSNIEDSDRVVVFTTNLGGPTASVPANSLIGQYVIKKRKRMVVEDKMASRYEVKGEFPRAVRDQHIMEVSTGVKLGVEGQGGVYQSTGWKRGNKRSKGYANDAPAGSVAMRDSNGNPVYDSKGNQRYTEGYTRNFRGGTQEVGLRIFIG